MAFIKNLAAPFLAAAVLAACGGGSGTTANYQNDKERIAALEADGKLPKLDRSTDLKGPDANSDGVRDDIEASLKGQFQGAQLGATMQFARAYQQVFDLPEGDRIAAKTLKIEGSRASNCLFDQFNSATRETNPYVVSDSIVSMTFNTKARLKAYMAYNKALSGSVWSLPEGDTCE